MISYFLSQDIFINIQSNLLFPLTTDCFAPRLIYKFPNYFSWNHDPLYFMINAFLVKWPNIIYIIPPLPLINKVITKFISDSVNEDLLISPFGLLVCGIPSYVSLTLCFSLFPSSRLCFG